MGSTTAIDRTTRRDGIVSGGSPTKDSLDAWSNAERHSTGSSGDLIAQVAGGRTQVQPDPGSDVDIEITVVGDPKGSGAPTASFRLGPKEEALGERLTGLRGLTGDEIRFRQAASTMGVDVTDKFDRAALDAESRKKGFRDFDDLVANSASYRDGQDVKIVSPIGDKGVRQLFTDAREAGARARQQDADTQAAARIYGAAGGVIQEAQRDVGRAGQVLGNLPPLDLGGPFQRFVNQVKATYGTFTDDPTKLELPKDAAFSAIAKEQRQARAEKVDINIEGGQPPQIQDVKVAIGDFVRQGDIIATLKSRATGKEIEGAERNLASANQSLVAQVNKAFREDLPNAKNSVRGAEAAVAKAKTGVAEAQNRVSQTQAQLAIAKDQLARRERLLEEGAVSVDSLAPFRLAVRSNEAAVQNARSGVQQAQSTLRGAEAELEKAKNIQARLENLFKDGPSKLLDHARNPDKAIPPLATQEVQDAITQYRERLGQLETLRAAGGPITEVRAPFDGYIARLPGENTNLNLFGVPPGEDAGGIYMVRDVGYAVTVAPEQAKNIRVGDRLPIRNPYDPDAKLGSAEVLSIAPNAGTVSGGGATPVQTDAQTYVGGAGGTRIVLGNAKDGNGNDLNPLRASGTAQVYLDPTGDKPRTLVRQPDPNVTYGDVSLPSSEIDRLPTVSQGLTVKIPVRLEREKPGGGETTGSGLAGHVIVDIPDVKTSGSTVELPPGGVNARFVPAEGSRASALDVQVTGITLDQNGGQMGGLGAPNSRANVNVRAIYTPFNEERSQGLSVDLKPLGFGGDTQRSTTERFATNIDTFTIQISPTGRLKGQAVDARVVQDGKPITELVGPNYGGGLGAPSYPNRTPPHQR